MTRDENGLDTDGYYRYHICLRFFTILVENFDGSQRPIRRPERPKAIGGDGREAMEGDCYVYDQWAICAKSLPITSKTEGEAMTNKEWLIVFL
jgi:hypothetical protein